MQSRLPEEAAVWRTKFRVQKRWFCTLGVPAAHWFWAWPVRAARRAGPGVIGKLLRLRASVKFGPRSNFPSVQPWPRVGERVKIFAAGSLRGQGRTAKRLRSLTRFAGSGPLKPPILESASASREAPKPRIGVPIPDVEFPGGTRGLVPARRIPQGRALRLPEGDLANRARSSLPAASWCARPAPRPP